MNIAELHGKIRKTGNNLSENMEDLLTSHVFGNLRYIPDEKGLNPILSMATNSEGHFLKLSGAKEWEYSFWPSFKHSQPDIYLENDKYKVVVEVKFHSGKSGVYEGEDRLSEEDEDYAYRDQLTREWMDLMERDKSKIPVLIYLTKDFLFPEDAFKQALNELSECKEKFKHNAYWLSWSKIYFQLYKMMKKDDYNVYEQRVLLDILLILERRNLRRFIKISVPSQVIGSMVGRMFYTPKLITDRKSVV